MKHKNCAYSRRVVVFFFLIFNGSRWSVFSFHTPMSTLPALYRETLTPGATALSVHKVNFLFLKQCESEKCFMRTRERTHSGIFYSGILP